MDELSAKNVHSQIEKFCASHQSTHIIPGYTFEHVVLGDFNLDDGYIRSCLSQADSWEARELKDLRKMYGASYEKCDLAYYVEEMKQYKKAAITFLNWLLSVPEDTRDEVTHLEYGEGR